MILLIVAGAAVVLLRPRQPDPTPQEPRYSGRVYADCIQDPLANAAVEIELRGGSIQTDNTTSDGVFSFPLDASLDQSSARVRIRAAGVENLDRRTTIKLNAEAEQFRLKCLPRATDKPVTTDDWVPSVVYQREFERQLALGFYPAVVQGRLQEGIEEYRAEWRPLSAGITFASHHGMMPAEYRERLERYASEGYEPVSLTTFADNGGNQRYQVTWLKK